MPPTHSLAYCFGELWHQCDGQLCVVCFAFFFVILTGEWVAADRRDLMFPYPSSIPVICTRQIPAASWRQVQCWGQVCRDQGRMESQELCNNPFVLQFRMVLFLACVRFSLKKQSDINKVCLQQRNAFARLLSGLVWFCSWAFSTDTYRKWGCGLIREEC